MVLEDKNTKKLVDKFFPNVGKSPLIKLISEIKFHSFGIYIMEQKSPPNTRTPGDSYSKFIRRGGRYIYAYVPAVEDIQNSLTNSVE